MPRRLLLFGVPVAVALLIAGHPPDPTTAGDLGAATGRYITLHVALLFLLPLLGVVVWKLLEGLDGLAASLARAGLAFALVFYAAFDSLVGIAAGVLTRETADLGGSAAPGAEMLVARWLEIPMPLSVVSAVGTVSWTVALLAAAVAHQRAGSSWWMVVGLGLAGPLFGFGHPLFLGVVGMAGLLTAAVVSELGRTNPLESEQT